VPRILVVIAFMLFVCLGVANARAVTPKHSVIPKDSTLATLSGFVHDSSSGESIIGATVRVRSLHLGAITNKSGFFTLHIPSGQEVLIEIVSLGYRTDSERVTAKSGEHLKRAYNLIPESVHEGDVTVESDWQKERQEPQVSRVSVSPKQIQELPNAGQADLFRILQFLPGVQTTSEISSGLYIRGGTPDQNLILLDGSVLYNPTHFFGFFSTFNPDAIKDVELIKGGFPAEYGGRLSAVLNVTDIDGDQNQVKGKVTAGLISSSATLEIPVGTGALVVSGRRTYFDELFNVTGLTNKLGLPDYYFYDLNGKLTQNPSPNDKITLSGYLGADNLNYDFSTAANNFFVDWGNSAGSGEWTHVFGSELFSKLDLSASSFNSNFTLGSTVQPFTWLNSIDDYTARFSLEYFPAQENEIKTGVQASEYHTTLKIQAGDNPPSANVDVTPFYGAAYVQDEWKPDISGAAPDPFAMTTGLRVDGISTNSEIGIDPRISARYIIDPAITLKASWGIYHQYLKLAANPNIPIFDVWVPTDSIQPPERAIQYVLGVSTIPFSSYTFDVETYYKSMQNIVEMKPNVTSGNSLEDVFDVGNGKAYGVEFFLQKQVGRLTGWVGYTLAWVWYQFPDLNNGVEFPPTYDRRNDIDVVMTYMLNDRWTIGATFTYGTGQAYTQVTALAPDAENPSHGIPIDGAMNDLRLPPYNRLDLSATYSFGFFTDKRNAEFNIDIFNAYDHRNVWISEVDQSTNPATITYVRLLPILPTFGLSVSF
jgi:hypothetical protein